AQADDRHRARPLHRREYGARHSHLQQVGRPNGENGPGAAGIRFAAAFRSDGGGGAMKPVRKAVIPAAGLGTRFLPATKAMPKEMLPIVDKPAIHHIVEEAARAGIEEIAIVTSRAKRPIEAYFKRNPELE